MNVFYVYEHWRPDTNSCFYVGKGKRSRAHNFTKRSAAHTAIVDLLGAQGLVAEVRIIASGLNEEAAFSIEKDQIAFWRSTAVPLANKTDGGEGFSGFKRPKGISLSPEARAKLSAARMGIEFSAEHREKLAKAKMGRSRLPFTEETKAKMRAAAAKREAAKREIYGSQVRRNSKVRTVSAAA